MFKKLLVRLYERQESMVVERSVSLPKSSWSSLENKAAKQMIRQGTTQPQEPPEARNVETLKAW
ncbi:uncharacterized protein PHALS_06062 [Plasmopara halstedii]|uniref:Uncharacterized protein n=1 Tax=Plasmopara halstedii TaxID=4781 RepID=A0A0P1AC21_PLAHL|nr:uncharacterized protein PHALS_06062 [Plasmopara halstedii]CEG38020.1 hypothetical protein PHALS_06062 [Plasmopara halstedii]|eukprot:XP_024574389.1 hypothetical protein PHALS_06062 [Plasmopara halstedii]